MLFFPNSCIYWCIFNTKAFPFHNLALRQAFAFAIQRETLVADCFLSLTPTYSPLLFSNVNPTNTFFSHHNKKKAIKLTQTTIVSQILGAKKHLSLQAAFKSDITLVSLMIMITSIPLLICPIPVFHFLFPKIALDPSVIRILFFGIWLSFVFFVMSSIPIGYTLAFKDMNFSVGMGFFNWINGFLLIYLTIQVLEAKAISFWLSLV